MVRLLLKYLLLTSVQLNSLCNPIFFIWRPADCSSNMVMAKRSSSQFTSKSSKPLGKKANVEGYAKRQARKSTSIHGLSSDVYEYAPEMSRRSKVTLDLNQDEAAEYRVGIDGGNDEDREEVRARLIGENSENERVGSEDDEEIDSDAAFEESDEERFAGFFSTKVSFFFFFFDIVLVKF